MTWTPLAERVAHLPLILAGPIVRRVEPRSVTVWLALREPRWVTLRVYASDDQGHLLQQCAGARHSIRLGDHLHVVAVTARPTENDQALDWGHLYYYNLFFSDTSISSQASQESAEETTLYTPGILCADPLAADDLHRLVYPGHPLPSFALPAREVGQLRIVHGSCRKPHGVGREMLSALDTIILNAVNAESSQQHQQRPQQLYLTGDQIYADDVATALLFALIDAGKWLFAGNEEEELPLINAPAHTLAPGQRAEAVYKKAHLTTSTPQNHVLSLAEYVALYLFSWSDTLWPQDLPDIEELWQTYPQTQPLEKQREQARATYQDQLTRLNAFRTRLPQARRALANIATYMICDDHEITDDWYLDGAWCQHVLQSPLGYRVVRNGLLAYALFQAWGNTPEQFALTNGSELLDAIDAWYGAEADAHVQLVEERIGMPAPFNGTGELQRAERALHWHYTYAGPDYQILVMDTRNARLYRAPDYFPGLLSPHAMQTQLLAPSREEKAVTIIISASPVLGVDFVESVQFWSRWRVRDNYAYDREAWALEWGTFQHLLKTVSRFKRIVFLSGDVHYAFGSSLEYWDHHTKATAKIVNYTSSAITNEGAGSQIAVLAVGYPRLLHLLRRHENTGVDFFAWDIVGKDRQFLTYMLSIIRRRLYRFWWAIPRLIAVWRSPYEIIFPAHGWLKGVFDLFPPDRAYRLRYLRNTLYKIAQHGPRRQLSFSRGIRGLLRLALDGLTLGQTLLSRLRGGLQRYAERQEQSKPPLSVLRRPSHALTQEALEETAHIERKLERRRSRLVVTLLRYEQWLSKWKAGELIIGYNNIGEISFAWDTDRKDVLQRLWWCRPDAPDHLLTADYSDSLELPGPEMEPPLP